MKEEFREIKDNMIDSNIHLIGAKEEENGRDWREAILGEEMQGVF